MIRLATITVCTTLALGLGVGIAAARPADRGTDLAGQAARIYEQATAIINANKGHCSKIGSALQKWSQHNKGALKDLGVKANHLTTAEKISFGQAFASKLATFTTQIQAGIAACSSSADVRGFLQGLGHATNGG